MIDLVELGNRIKKQRELLGYTREHLAELVNVTPRFCYDLELGLKRNVTGNFMQPEQRF